MRQGGRVSKGSGRGLRKICAAGEAGLKGVWQGSSEDLYSRPEEASSKGLWKIYVAGRAGLEGVWQGFLEDLCGRPEGESSKGLQRSMRQEGRVLRGLAGRGLRKMCKRRWPEVGLQKPCCKRSGSQRGLASRGLRKTYRSGGSEVGFRQPCDRGDGSQRGGAGLEAVFGRSVRQGGARGASLKGVWRGSSEDLCGRGGRSQRGLAGKGLQKICAAGRGGRLATFKGLWKTYAAGGAGFELVGVFGRCAGVAGLKWVFGRSVQHAGRVSKGSGKGLRTICAGGEAGLEWIWQGSSEALRKICAAGGGGSTS
uniref:Uncharacterized protein n=1 Tax=Chromera velia CCMP2878 TaxID=1169474 RepID=A0A0G4GGI7_9ALVE